MSIRPSQSERAVRTVTTKKPCRFLKTLSALLVACSLLLAASHGSTVSAEHVRGDSPTGIMREFQADAFSPGDHALRLVVTLDRSSLTLAERLTVRLEAQMPLGWHVEWPTLGDELGEFTVSRFSEPETEVIHRLLPEGGANDTGQKSGDTGESGIGRSIRRELVLIPSYAEKLAVPSFEVTFVAPSDVIAKPIKLKTEIIEVSLRSLIDATEPAPDATKLRGITSIKPGLLEQASFFIDEHRWLLVGSCSVIAAGVATAWIVVACRRRTLALSPASAARLRMGRVDLAAITTHEQIASAMVELADIAREYATAQFKLEPTDRTTEQLVTVLSSVHPTAAADLRRMLTQFDFVKFAGAAANKEDVAAAFADLRTFVEATCNVGANSNTQSTRLATHTASMSEVGLAEPKEGEVVLAASPTSPITTPTTITASHIARDKAPIDADQVAREVPR